MFGLLHNLYHYVRKKTERKVTFVLLGLDNAGKTTLSNTLKGELDEEVSPSYGFNKCSLSEGKYKIDIFDLGGGKNIRKIWKTYLAEVHGLVFVVDAADPSRFPEAAEVLADLATDPGFQGKALLVLANKQDLPVAVSSSEVAQALGLTALMHNSYNILPCCAKAPPAASPAASRQADPRVHQALKWLIGQVDSVYTRLDVRVQVEAEAARQEALRRKRERDEAAKRAREERMRLRELEEASATSTQEGTPLIGTTTTVEAASSGDTTHNVLMQPVPAPLPNSIETPKPMTTPLPPLPSPTGDDLNHQAAVEFSDLRPRADQRISGSDPLNASRRHTVPPLVVPAPFGPRAPATVAFASPTSLPPLPGQNSNDRFMPGVEATTEAAPPALGAEPSGPAPRVSRPASPKTSMSSGGGNRIAPASEGGTGRT